MKYSIYLFTTIIFIAQLHLGTAQCSAKSIAAKRFYSCIYTSVYAPYKKQVTLSNNLYRNVTVSLTSSYIPKLSGNTLVLTSGYYLVELSITRSKLQTVEPDTFTTFGRLEILNLSNNNMTSLQNRMFNTSKTLLALNVSHNNISEIGAETFYSTPLQSLDLSHNKISKIGNAEFKDLHFIKWLNLSYNVIKVVDYNVFEGVINLIDLDLKANRIQVLPSCLMHLSLLTTLDLSDNLISTLNPGVFTGLNTLRNLDISFNKFETVPWVVFRETPALISLNIKGNNISYTGYNLDNFPSGISVRNLTLGRNKLGCDQLKTLLKIIKSLGISVMQSFDELNEVNINGIACNFENFKKVVVEEGKSEPFEGRRLEDEGARGDLDAGDVSKIISNVYVIYFLLVLLLLMGFIQIVGCYLSRRRSGVSRNIGLGILDM